MTPKKSEPKTTTPKHVLTPQERVAFEKLGPRLLNNATPPLKIVKNKIEIQHRDEAAGQFLMMSALGTADSNFMSGLLHQIANAASSQGQPPNDVDLNFMVAVIADINPRDQLESMLAAHMAAVHVAAMRAASRLANSDDLIQHESAERIFTKLTRTFTTQLEALKRSRASGEQTMTVQNVSVQDGGQAIVGNITQRSSDTAPESVISTPAIPAAQTAPMAISGHESQPIPLLRKLK